MPQFRWNDWNIDHVTKHGVTCEDAEAAIRSARPPYPRQIEDDKWLVWGRALSGTMIQVIYVVDPDDTLYVIHARPLTDREKRRFRRQSR